MGRHSKNAGTGHGGLALTNAERAELNFGTVAERLGSDSVKPFDCCALSLQPVHTPVVTPGGVLYEREAILECLLEQKKRYAQQLHAWQAAQAGAEATQQVAAQAAQTEKLARFEALQNGGAGGAAPAAGPAHGGLRAFWVPALAPSAEAVVAKPCADTLCPATAQKLRLKDLLAVRFTRAPGDEPESGSRFQCPVCSSTLTNVTRVVVLKPGGQALCEPCYVRFVQPEGRYDGAVVKDAIRLERGGTGFAATSRVEASTYAPLGLGSGLAPVRGQSGGRSKFAGMRL